MPSMRDLASKYLAACDLEWYSCQAGRVGFTRLPSLTDFDEERFDEPLDEPLGHLVQAN